MRMIKTPTGKIYEVNICATIRQTYNSVLFIEFVGGTIPDIASKFSDATETSVIYEYVDDEPRKTLIGYTNLTEVSIMDGNVRIKLETDGGEGPTLPPPQEIPLSQITR